MTEQPYRYYQAVGLHRLANTELPYDVVVADPPWKLPASVHSKESPGNVQHYPTMSLDEIVGLPVPHLLREGGWLFLWSIDSMLHHAFHILDSWGLEYYQALVWVKRRPSTIKTFFARYQEYVLVARSKRPWRPNYGLLSGGKRSVFEGDVPEKVNDSRHAVKPDWLQDVLDEGFPDSRKIELFARRTREGWDAWGNEKYVVGNTGAGRNEARQAELKEVLELIQGPQCLPCGKQEFDVSLLHLDREVPSDGYVLPNCALLCAGCNGHKGRNRLTYEQMREWR